jgi:hypothetical protein
MIGYFRNGILCRLLANEKSPKRLQRSKMQVAQRERASMKNATHEYRFMSAEDAQAVIYLAPDREKINDEFAVAK